MFPRSGGSCARPDRHRHARRGETSASLARLEGEPHSSERNDPMRKFVKYFAIWKLARKVLRGGRRA
ncbi:hypothetical protein [Limimaricola litoreus]|uniref:Uncharacterized protein n=1 Tax=Limimaricola litoreus TaxID=2955316 RepID=A0A9X2FXB8_9RHOB|nr:hypothetical protein [Limimaricola litoreus]MCP1169313.1 hypothetical protein [Limimaricola litoreus]